MMAKLTTNDEQVFLSEDGEQWQELSVVLGSSMGYGYFRGVQLHMAATNTRPVYHSDFIEGRRPCDFPHSEAAREVKKQYGRRKVPHEIYQDAKKRWLDFEL